MAFSQATLPYKSPDDFFWVINQDPYPSEASFYGNGELLFFVKNYKNIFGITFTLLGIIGGINLFIKLFDKANSKQNLFWWLLIIIPGITIFSVHSYIWWKGIKGSLGLLRVMATIIPTIALVAIFGLQWILSFMKSFIHNKQLKNIIQYTISCLLVVVLSKQIKENLSFPIIEDEIQTLLTKAGNWYKNNRPNGMTYYLDPYFGFRSNINPFDSNVAQQLWYVDKKIPSAGLKRGDRIVWDAHFGPNECGIPKEHLLNDTNLQLIQEFHPKHEIITLGEYPYEILIFEVI